MTDAIYSPILKTKPGEARAVVRLDRVVKASIIPFFDVLALKAGTTNGADVHMHMEKQANNVAGAWNGRGPCYVDLFDVTPSARGYDGAHPATIIHDRISFECVEAIPVVGIERDVAYKLAIRRVVSAGADAIAVRLAVEDIQLPSTLVQRISTLLAEVGAADLPVHVFMDFRSIENVASDTIQMRVNKALPELRKLNPARIVFAASAIVSDMGGFKRNSVNALARRDLLVWQLIAELHPDVEYADYGIIHPEYLDIDPKVIKPAAKIRYAGDKDWLIVKGIKWVTDTSQHRKLSKMLCDQAEFRGKCVFRRSRTEISVDVEQGFRWKMNARFG
ncbi:beta family protein [Paraburkholderia fungorum]|uniref:beta family protein n=1 Tax=Paraburkholderia fungorum TaxID=134537 RepID=UPI003D65E84B